MLSPSRRGCASREPRRRRGTATVELAVLLPFLALIFVIGIDWCRIFYAVTTVDDCARSGALAASGVAYQERGLTSSQRTTRGTDEAIKGGTNLSPPLSATGVSVATGSTTVTVQVSYDFHTISLWPGVGGTYHITRTVEMAILPQTPTSP